VRDPVLTDHFCKRLSRWLMDRSTRSEVMGELPESDNEHASIF
jgi:hypothetical protein